MKLLLRILLLINLPLVSNAQLWKIYKDLMESSSTKGDYINAIEWGQRTIHEYEKEFGKEDSVYATLLNNLAMSHKNMDNYKEAEPLFLQSMKIYKKLLGEEHPDYLGSVKRLANLYQSTGKFLEAEILYTQLMEINKKLLGTKHIDYITTLFNLAILYDEMVRNSEAEHFFLEALNILKKTRGEEDLDFAGALNNLGSMYTTIGRYGEAEPLLIQAEKIRKKVLGIDNTQYLATLNSLAILHYRMGRYESAKSFYLQRMKIQENLLGKDHPDYAISLDNLAILYSDMGRNSEVETLAIQAMKIAKNNFGEDHLDYAAPTATLANLYYDRGRYQEALPLFIQVSNIRKKVLGEDHPLFASSVSNLALLYKSMGCYDEAESLNIMAMNIFKKAMGEEHPNYNKSLINLASLYAEMGRYSDAKSLYLKSLLTIKKYLAKTFPYLSEQEQQQFLATITSDFEQYKSFSLDYPLAIELGYNAELFGKGLLISSAIKMSKNILSTDNKNASALFNRWNSLRAMLAKQYSKPIRERVTSLDTLEKEANKLEKQLTSIANSPKESQSLFTITWNNVYAQLKSYEVTIEFSSFHYSSKNWTDSIFYCAFLLRGGDTIPKQIFLFEQRQLDSLFMYDGEKAEFNINRLYDWRNVNGLYKLLWEKIEPYLRDVSIIYYSPSGSLHKISFPAIPLSDSTLLSDKYHLIQLNSTREITLERFKPVYVTDTSSIALFGGIQYDMDTAALKSATASYHIEEQDQLFAFASRSYVSDTSSRGTSWRYLPGTLSEVEFIKPLFKQSNLFTGVKATEEAFKSLQGKQAPDMLHIATHGFFFKGGVVKKEHDGKIREFEYSNDPLIRSGLLLAGSNLKWKGVEIPENLEDGILTAKEVTSLNLYNTKLVVLSACETGLGDIQGSEGVYGLQRAFKAAGADYLLMSLWSVPDKPTAEFMQTFYSKLKTGSDIQTAFEQTQTAMKLQYKNEPYNWAGFVLVR